MPYPRFIRARQHKQKVRSAGTITVNWTVWTAVDTALDIALAAAAGDDIEYSLSYFSGNEAVSLGMDVALMNGSTALSWFGTSGGIGASTGNGISGWLSLASSYGNNGGSVFKTLAASDIIGGKATLRLHTRVLTAGSKTLYGTGDNLLYVWARNIGPAAS